MERLLGLARRSWLIRWLMLASGALVALILASCTGVSISTSSRSTATPPPTVVTTPTSAPASAQQNVAYGPLAAERLDLCRPQGARSPRPGVILIHGGGWSAGDKTDFSQICLYLAAHGFVAATVNYRLAPASIWPAQLVDVQLAVRWLRAHAGTLGLDPARLCSYGASAGGHLAVFLGVLRGIHAGDEASLVANQAPSASCVVDEFGPVDLTDFSGAGGALTPVQRLALGNLLGGATPQSDPAIYRDASPIIAVSPSSAPTLIVQGTQDTTVPPSQSQELQHALQQAGVPVQYIAYPGDHGFSGLSTDQILTIALQTVSYLTAQEHP